jgi:hypothetical protein
MMGLYAECASVNLVRSWVSLLIACVAFAGCARVEPMERKVRGDSGPGLLAWRAKMADELTPSQWADFNEALQEIKYRIMADGEASGSGAIEEAMLTRIDGHTVREVIITGLSLEVYRVEAERAEAAEALAHNTKLRTRKGDEDSAQYLSSVVNAQQLRLQAAMDKLAPLEERLRALGASPELAKKGPGHVTPPGDTVPEKAPVSSTREL